jgi:hypothetical protein
MSFVRHSADFFIWLRCALPMKADGLDTNKKFLHGLMAAFLFCGGEAVAAMPLFRARLIPRRLPPHPRTPARARADARVADARVG